jgi:acyl-CoA thioesterase-1
MRIVLITILSILVQLAAAQDTAYLSGLKTALQQKWPANRTINLVFHGHSVPSGYFNTPNVKTLDAYPQLVLQALKQKYPYAVINVITTAIGGENSSSGAKRFKKDVLPHRPDVLFIDYALNDRKLGLEQTEKNWRKMIRQALKKKIPVILLTPSPDTSVEWTKAENELAQLAAMITRLAREYGIGLADSYGAFIEAVNEGRNIKEYMSQSNHPNRKGHELIAAAIIKYF